MLSGLEEKLGRSPLELLSGCFVWIPIGIMILCLASWMFQGEVDVITGLIGISVGVLVGVATMNPKNAAFAPLLLFLITASVVVFPVVRFIVSKRELDMVDVDSIELGYQTMLFKKNDLGARLRIAKGLWNRGVKGAAINIAEEALEHVPENTMIDEFRMLDRWIQETDPDKIDAPLTCLECGLSNPPNKFHCPRCGSPILLEYAKGKVFNPFVLKRLVSSWTAALAVIIGVPMAAASLKPPTSIAMILLFLAASGIILFRNFASPRGSRLAR